MCHTLVAMRSAGAVFSLLNDVLQGEGALGVTMCYMCHVKSQFRALSQRDPWVGPGDSVTSHSFALGLLSSQTSLPSTPNL